LKVLFDIDGSLCHPDPALKKISKKVAKTNLPWPIIHLGLILVRQVVDEEMVDIVNELYHSEKNDAWINSIRPKQSQKLTQKFFKKNGVSCCDRIECLGLGNGPEKKVINALKKGVDIVVDDDGEVLAMAAEYGMIGCEPDIFKRLYKSGTFF